MERNPHLAVGHLADGGEGRDSVPSTTARTDAPSGGAPNEDTLKGGHQTGTELDRAMQKIIAADKARDPDSWGGKAERRRRAAEARRYFRL